MRLNRLDLIRYGRFSDAEIIFPKPAQGAPDVTVVFGPNEAGKSTTFHAFLELLFGFKSGQHPYAFRFERSDLLVGAELELPERGPVVLRRNSKRTQSLLDASDRPVSEGMLTSALHGLTRDAFEERFSLNEKGLREGGERIAGAQGDLGQLLHAGLSGLTGMSQTLDALSARADRFHKKRGRGTVLKVGSDRLKVIGQELRADRLTTEKERRLREDRDQRTVAFDAADTALRQAHQRQAAGRAAQVWYDRAATIEELSQALSDLPDGPDLPAGAAAHVAGLIEKITALSVRITESDAEIAKLDVVITEHPEDVAVVPLRAELDRLDQLTIAGAPLMGRASTAQADLARRVDEKAELAAQIKDALSRLRVPDAAPSALALEPDALEALAGAVQQCLTAHQSLGAAESAADAARAQLGDAPVEPQDLTALRAAFDAWRGVADLSAAEQAQERALATRTKAVAGLPSHWSALIDAGLPARETLDDVAREWTTLTADLASARSDLDVRAAELAAATADHRAQEAAPDVVDLAMTEQTRRKRDMVWQRHRDGLTPASADEFEDAMTADDGARAHYLSGAEARQRLRAAQSQLQTAKARHDTAQSLYDGLATRREEAQMRCGKLALALGLAEDASPSAFVGRLQALEHAADAAADVVNAQTALKAREVDQNSARDGLAQAAGSLGLDTGGDISTVVHRALTLEDSNRKAWDKWQDGAQALADLDDRAAQCAENYDLAQAQLDRMTAALPLADRTVEGVQAALPDLRQLHQVYAEHGKLSTRVEALEHAIDALKTGARRLARIMGDAGDGDPVQVIDDARARLIASERSGEKREDALRRREDTVAAKQRADTDLANAEAELAACFKRQATSDLPPRERVALLEKRDGLRAEKRVAENERDAARAGVDADLFDEELTRLPDATRMAELAQAVTDAQDLRDTARDAEREAARVHRATLEAADRSDLATEQATLQEELREGARQAAVARLGVLAARGALRRLAAERRSTMLRDVEAAFVAMTAPAWTGVDVWSQSDGEKLVGIQPSGNTVPVEQMSTGTMGQLYFALRLAGYRSFARDMGPLPMVLDDIMETFDDTRARAALKLCADIGAEGQAILFTHHAHLVDLARDTIEGVAVVDMPDRA
ncbi:AAA family ATPase [Litoreibacter albidus]|uniref:Uncharacterized protein YhaN n=1 Tax=Litoreibacter albidus TaxID=670155 RepID=A0A1H3CWZ1_9RHOB|nr:AAA family ATPase [Litoreibacter albidus]SDX58635.1 Uncharacterized protein YhaN [Litoreibacter albidus]